MNYQRIYNQLIENRKLNPLDSSTYGEIHHIIPTCMGGLNIDENKVKLTAREHYLAHALLYFHYRTTKLAHAWFSMVRKSDNQERFFSSKQYEMARIAHSNEMKNSMCGEGNHFYGRKHTEETKQKISAANTGKVRSDETIQNWVEKVAKKPKTQEHKNKIGRKGMVMLKNIFTEECIRISKEESINYDKNIWKNPFAIKKLKEKLIENNTN